MQAGRRGGAGGIVRRIGIVNSSVGIPDLLRFRLFNLPAHRDYPDVPNTNLRQLDGCSSSSQICRLAQFDGRQESKSPGFQQLV